MTFSCGHGQVLYNDDYKTRAQTEKQIEKIVEEIASPGQIHIIKSILS